MIRKYNNNNVASESFNSVNEFIKTIARRDVNKAFTTRKDDLSSDKSSFEFAGSNDFNEAQDLLKTGYKEGLENMMNTDSKVKVSNKNTKNVRTSYYYGSSINISNVLTGQPKTMYRRHTEIKKVKTIEINYDVCLSGSTDSHTLTLGGKNIISLVKHFENQGMNVKLNIFFAINTEWKKDAKMAAMTIKIKDYTQKINPLLVSYVITHPSFFRRHCFRWIETSELTSYKSLVYGYGYVSNMMFKPEAMTNKLRENNVISKEGYYINVTDAAQAQSIDDLVSLLGVKS